MNIEDIKKIPLADYLHSLGYSPVKQQGNNLWYKSPLREEHEPSFKVNTDRNLWYDFGAAKGGNIIALAEVLYSSDCLPYLLDRIAEQTPHIRPTSFSFDKQSFSQPSFRQLKVHPLSSPALLAYLRDRAINLELAEKECKEVRFRHNDKWYFAIGFANASGGYEIRNKYFKGSIAPKDITRIWQNGKPKETCYVFEGFMDYLSYLTERQKYYPDNPGFDKQDYIILNSVSNIGKALPPLGCYEKIHCFFDNDRAGLEAYQTVRKEYDIRVHDSSCTYSGYKDLNEYLCREQTGKSEEQKQQIPGEKRKRGLRL